MSQLSGFAINYADAGSATAGLTPGRLCASIATLRATSVIGSGVVGVAAYTAGGGFGGGVFTYQPGDTTSADNGGTIIVDTAGHRWYRNLDSDLYPEFWGADPTGATDSTTAMQAAINWSASSGRKVLAPGKYLCGNLNVPCGARLEGEGNAPMAQQPASFANFYANKSNIVQTAGSTITVQDGASLRGLQLIRAGLPLILSAGGSSSTTINALIAAFSGVSITCPDQEVYLEDLLILGHTNAIDLGNAGAGMGRPVIKCVKGDNTNGLNTTTGYDLGTFEDVEWWPYLTSDAVNSSSYTDGNWRSGAGFYVANRLDWTVFTRCFAYGYASGAFVINGAAQIRLDTCAMDSPGDKNTYVGVQTEGSWSGALVMTDCINQAGIGGCVLVVGSPPSDPAERAVMITNCQFAGVQYGINVTNGGVIASGNTFDTCNVGIEIIDTSSISRISNNIFNNVTTHYSVATGSLSTVFIDGWTLPFSFTPVITAPSATGAAFGSITATGRLGPGKFSFQINFTVTAAGTGGGAIVVSTPETASASSAQLLNGLIVGGNLLAVQIPNASASLAIAQYNNATALGTGNVIALSGQFDIAIV